MAGARKAKRRAKKRCRKPLKVRSRVVRRKGKRRREYYCARPHRGKPKPPAQGGSPTPTPTPSPPVVVPPPPPAVSGPPVEGVPVYDGPFGRREAERLLWRAGFGPTRGQGDALAQFGVQGAVRSLTRPQVPEQLIGPEPPGGRANPLIGNGNDHLWWFDRMVRTNRPLIERMTLIWHDWFATSNTGVNSVTMMLTQNEMFRREGLGPFRQLLLNIASDGAMLKWLNGTANKKGRPNENYARESMELFSLGADRGAYTEFDVREMARAHTGWASDPDPEGQGDARINFRIWPPIHDQGEKTIFGQTGNFDWADATRLCWEHPLHPSFLVDKLWSYFIPTPPDDGTRAALEGAYTAGGSVVLPLVEAILMHPDLYRGESMVKPPVVFAAGLVRTLGKGVGGAIFTWTEMAGQRLFYPPNVDGWHDHAWLDTTTMRARWMIVYYLLNDGWIDMGSQEAATYDPAETPSRAVARALDFWGDPPFSDASREALERWAAETLSVMSTGLTPSQRRAMRQNALRHLVGASPDLQLC
jgi:hypothetical protein